MKTLHLILIAGALLWGVATQGARVESYPVSAVRLTPSPFDDARRMDIRYLLALDPDRLLAPYLREAGLTPKAPTYTNWEDTGLDGHIGGHYLSALSYMYAATGDDEIKHRLDYMLAELRRCQDAAGDGYLCGAPGGRRIWDEVSRGDIRAGAFSLNGGWVPLYNIHKIFAGLRDAWLQTGSEDARTMLIDLTDWMERTVSGLTDRQIQQMLASEHGDPNEVFADVAAITGDDRYLTLARRFSHRTLLDPLLRGEDKLTGMHANTQILKVIGFKRIADLTGDKAWDGAARLFWTNVTGHRSVSIGGNSVREHFHPADDFSSMMSSEQGPETCNTYNMLRLSKMLYESSADTRYIDYYERALYNHILSTIDPVQGGFVYFTPMRPGHYRVYSQPQTSMWCCVGSGLENHARYGEAIYAHASDTIFVNLFIPSVLTSDNAGLELSTDFPRSGKVTVKVNPRDEGREFALALRIPSWTASATLAVNGTPQPIIPTGGYATVRRTWHRGDSVTLTLPMHLKAEPLPDGSNYVSFLYGPVVLAAATGTERQDGLFADDSRGGHIADGPRIPLHRLHAIISDDGDLLSHLTPVAGEPLRFTLSGLTDTRFEGLTLRPFATLRESRYMVYFPHYTQASWQATHDSIAAAEEALMRLDAITADIVTCGEQQPESDHFITMQDSRTGSDDGLRWRETSGTVTYRMNPASRPVTAVRVTYRPDARRSARILIDRTPIGTLPAGTGTGTLTHIDLPLPAAINTPITLTITPADTPTTPHIYTLRLLTE